MAEVDTSSYPKPVQSNFLDTAQKYQTLESNKLGIDQNKLKLANERLTMLAKGVSTLMNDPDLTGEKVINEANYMAKQLGIPDDMKQNFLSQFPTSGTKEQIQTGLNKVISQAQHINEALHYSYGVNGTIDTGGAIQPIVSSPKPGFGIRSTGAPIAKQPGPGQVEYDESGQPRYRGVQPPQGAPGLVTAPPMAPGYSKDTGVNLTGPNRDVTAINGIPINRGAAAGPTPLFEEGKKAYTEDQGLAAQRLTQIKPAIQALKLMPGLSTGPGTEQFTNLVALAKAWGVVDTKAANDPTVLRQELEKKLAQYVGSSPVAARSDAAQVLAEAGSPNPKKQILPALINLTRDSIALDRAQALRPFGFKDTNYAKYGEHRGSFPAKVDERALSVDLLSPEERQKLVNGELAKAKKGDAKAMRFFETLDLAKKSGILITE